jgi:hypothetical protein
MDALGIVLGVILVVAVALPIVIDQVNNSTATGTTKTVLDVLPIFVALGALYFIARSAGLIG